MDDVPQTVKEVAHQLTANNSSIYQVADMFLSPWNILVCLALIGIGITLKMSKKFPDYGILFVMLPLGIAFAELLLTFTFHIQLWSASMMIGICDGVAAFYVHQLLKQTLESPLGKTLQASWPTIIGILAIISGADMNKAQTQAISKAVNDAELTKEDTQKIVQVIKGTGEGTIQLVAPPAPSTPPPADRPSSVFVIPPSKQTT